MTDGEIMTPYQAECKESFLGERVAMLVYDAGLTEQQAIEQANRMWVRYAIKAGIIKEDG